MINCDDDTCHRIIKLKLPSLYRRLRSVWPRHEVDEAWTQFCCIDDFSLHCEASLRVILNCNQLKVQKEQTFSASLHLFLLPKKIDELKLPDYAVCTGCPLLHSQSATPCPLFTEESNQRLFRQFFLPKDLGCRNWKFPQKSPFLFVIYTPNV